MKYKEAIKQLEKFKKFGSQLGLSRVRKLLNEIGNPQKNLKVIHVAGTNGKGSVCAMVSQILISAGYTVGTYTSPELIDIRERFQVNLKKIPKKTFAELISKYHKKAEKFKCTPFEFLTAIAFEYFKEQKVNYAVVEVGLGGRLDATNIPKPIVSVITNVDLEHTEILGKTIEAIAREKAGIIKKGVPVVTAAKGKSLNVIKEVSSKKKAPLIIVRKPYPFELNLNGDFQKINAAVAFEVSKILKINENIARDALKKVKWPGVFEIHKNKFKIILDSAHNPAGIKAIVKEVEKIKHKKLILVFGSLGTKNYRQMLKYLSKVTDFYIFTKPKSERALSPLILAESIGSFNVAITDSIKEAIKLAEKIAGRNDLILVTGSHYLVGPVLKSFNQQFSQLKSR